MQKQYEEIRRADVLNKQRAVMTSVVLKSWDRIMPPWQSR